MESHPAGQRALVALSHPLAIGAVALLLINDHVLRRLWPSWITGKLGDAAWLVFAPLLLAVALELVSELIFGIGQNIPSLAFPLRGRAKERADAITAGLAFGLTGLVFTLGKTLPGIHAVSARTLEALTGAPSALLRDPSDLLALPALLVGWHIWQQSRAHAQRRAWGRVALVLGVLATLANSPAADYGIDCLQRGEDSTLLALSRYSWQGDVYTSSDGGLTWEAAPPGTNFNRVACGAHTRVWEMADPADGRVVYRFTPGERIERSDDGGQTWQSEIRLAGSEARTVYYRLTRQGAYSVEPGPLDALFDEDSGNLIAAMGHEGLLVRTRGGTWQWIGLGAYVREDMRRVDQVWALLWGESVLALELAALAVGTLALLLRRARVWGIVLGVIAWAVWIVAVILSPAMNASTYIEFPATIALIGAGLIALGWAVGSVVMTGRKDPGRLRAAALPLALTALAGVVLFLLPYVLWAVGSVPRYSTAVIFGLLLAAVTVAAGGATVARMGKSE